MALERGGGRLSCTEGWHPKSKRTRRSGRREEVEKHGSYHDTSRRGCARYARAQPTRVCTHDTVKLPRQKQLRYSPTVRVTRPWDNEDNQTAIVPAVVVADEMPRALPPDPQLPRDKSPSWPGISSHNRPLAFSPSSSVRPHAAGIHLTNRLTSEITSPHADAAPRQWLRFNIRGWFVDNEALSRNSRLLIASLNISILRCSFYFGHELPLHSSYLWYTMPEYIWRITNRSNYK